MNIEKLIKLHGFDVHGGCPGRYPSIAIKESDLRAWMAGHVRVPVVPTEAMLDAMIPDSGVHEVVDLYKAMLAASKEPHNE